jgi:hypothetical protein
VRLSEVEHKAKEQRRNRSWTSRRKKTKARLRASFLIFLESPTFATSSVFLYFVGSSQLCSNMAHDASSLDAVFRASLSADPNVRIAGELELKKVSKTGRHGPTAFFYSFLVLCVVDLFSDCIACSICSSRCKRGC